MIGMDRVALLPPKPGTCPECGDCHDARDPHNRESIYYQMRFNQRNGRFPTWADAMAHCDDGTKRNCLITLTKKGVPHELIGEKE